MLMRVPIRILKDLEACPVCASILLDTQFEYRTDKSLANPGKIELNVDRRSLFLLLKKDGPSKAKIMMVKVAILSS